MRKHEVPRACWCECVRLQYVCLAYEVRVCVCLSVRAGIAYSVCVRCGGRGAVTTGESRVCVCRVKKKAPGPCWHHLGRVPRWAVNTQPNCRFSLPEMEF